MLLHRKLHFNANPRERYTLCYMQRRGWIIKPRIHRKRKHYLHKYYPIDNIDKSCVAAKNKQYPESKRCPYCPKTSFVIPPKQKKRNKSVSLTRDSFRKLKHINQSKSVTTKQKVFRNFKTAWKNIKSVACETDIEAWQNDYICKDIYVSNLRTKPWFWVYKFCPFFYPYFLVFIRFNENCAHCFLLMVSSYVSFHTYESG
ncbi:uncharacterized protein LOC125065446 [Vanessa atalanta]|uniref:uncharacterized protein LOC125065446 n=1 Tax=Vanessa atalanta TaxID=42275 RepID=UPI001FCDECAA|nr:uncharacterized protein LOC125065446 [Vanessa atalanta]